MIKAEIITIGDEILYGQITDTNTQWISAELDKIGIKTVRKSSVGDQKEEILQILEEAQNRADIILITGGLGPTKDDITKKTLCEHFDTKLIWNQEAITWLEEFFAKRGRKLDDINIKQAELPENAIYLKNSRGTAPGMWFEFKGKIFVSMPGVPMEMKGLMTDSVLAKLKIQFKTPIIYHKIIRTIGIGESFLSKMIEDWEDSLPSNIKLAYLPSMGNVKLRLTGVGEDLQEIQNNVQKEIEQVLSIISEYVYGYDAEEIEDAIGKLLLERKETVSTAESCTGGYVSHLITKVPGSSAYFEGGVVSYSYEAKETFLDVKAETLVSMGAVSEQTISEMAENVRKKFGTTYGLATSGIAGPGGGTPDKPVGTVWIAVATAEKTITSKLQLGGSRDQNIHLTAFGVLNLLRKEILEVGHA